MIIKTSHLIGSVKLPPSKSILHRLLIAAALSSEKSEISGVKLSDDITATINGLTAMGTDFFLNDDIMTVTALCKSDFAKIDCIESGSTLRFLMPICAALGINCEFSGIGRLPERPLNDYLRLFSEHNIKIDGIKLPIKLSGKLTPGRFELPGNISSQFVTGLLFALPLLEEDSEIVLTSPLESKGYANMTIFVLKKFSIEIMQTETGYKIKGNQKYSSCNLYAEGDWSAATFFMLAGALGGKIKLLNLSNASCQSDMACFEVFKAFGAATDKHENYISCKKGDLHGIKIDASEIPDMVPCIAAAAAMADGITEIFGASRLRFKESNRI
ncbi:MAG: 3-phosphoshikimate 1-carboxyvinyltransferase, partial [Oscillospiraceae bacterium]